MGGVKGPLTHTSAHTCTLPVFGLLSSAPQGAQRLQAFHFPLTLDNDCGHVCFLFLLRASTQELESIDPRNAE